MLLLLNTSCFLSRVIETYCNITWFVWYQILTHNWILVAFRFLEFPKAISLSEKLTSLLISAENWNEKKWLNSDGRYVLTVSTNEQYLFETWQMDLLLIICDWYTIILSQLNEIQATFMLVTLDVGDTSIGHQDHIAPEWWPISNLGNIKSLLLFYIFSR